MSYLDQPAILQKLVVDSSQCVQANEILANNSKFLSTASVSSTHNHGGAWPGRPFGGCDDGVGYHQHRSATCSPQRRGRSVSHIAADGYHEVMAQANQYRPKPYFAKGGLPLAPSSVGPAGLTEAQHRPSYAISTHSVYGASPVPPTAPGFLGYRADHHHAPSQAMVPSVDASVPTMYQHQIKKMYRDFQSQARDLEREMKEGERLRQELEERDAAVQDARAVARTAKQQLEQESFKRREVETKLADAQRDRDTAYTARLVSDKQLDDVRCLAISLEEQLRDRSHASQNESVLRHEAERARQHIESLEVQLRTLHDQHEARGAALADAERAAKNSFTDAAVLRAQLAVYGPSRLTNADDSGIPQEADTAQFTTMQQQHQGSSLAGHRGGQEASGPSVEVVQLQCVVEAKDRDLTNMKSRISTLQAELEKARQVASGESAAAVAETQRALMEVDAQKQALERRAAEAEGGRTLLQAECVALKQDVERLRQELESTVLDRRQGGQVPEMHNLSSSEPAVIKDGASKALSDSGSGPPVAGTLSLGSAHSWRIEAGGKMPAATAGEEGARLRAALEEARNLHTELEVSSGEHIRALQLQVRELQQQLSDQLQESIGDGARPGREAALQQRVQQLETMLRHARDIHGVSMPLLDSDEGVLMDPPQLPTADAAAAKAAKQLQSEVPQKLEWLQGKLEEAERRNADNKRTQQASADAAQARIHDLEAQVQSLSEALAASRSKLEGTKHNSSSNRDELAALYSTIEALRREQSGLSEQLHQAQAQHASAQQGAEAAQRELAAARQAVSHAQEQAGQHMEEVAEVGMRLAAEERTAAAARHDAEVARAEVASLCMEVGGLRGQLEEAEGRYKAGHAAVEREAADAASEVVFLQREVEVLKQKLEVAEQDARCAAASAAAAASGDLEGLQGQNETLREEVMDLRLRLEGASAAAEEVAQLREREGQLRQELEDAQQSLSQKQEQAGDSTWVWAQVKDLSVQISTLRDMLSQSNATVEDLRSKLALAEASGAPATSADTSADQSQQLQAEISTLREDLEAAERARDEHSARMESLRMQLGEVQTSLANEEMRQEEATRAVGESHARERALEEELAAVRGDLVEAQRSLVAAAQAPEELAGAMSDVAVRALAALRQGVADAFSSNATVAHAAAACNDERLLGAVSEAVADMQRFRNSSADGEGASASKLVALQQDLEYMNIQRVKAEKAVLESEVEIGQLCDRVDMEADAREQAEAACEDLRQRLQLSQGELERAKRSAAQAALPETPQPRALTIPPLNPAAAGSPEESKALRQALQEVTARAESLEQDLARLNMDMPEVESQRDQASSRVTELEQQLKDIKLKGFDFDIRQSKQRVNAADQRAAAAEAAAGQCREAAAAAVAARDAAVANAQAEIKKHEQRIQELERELSQRPQPKARAPLTMPPSHGAPGSPTKRGAPKLRTPQPRSVVRSDTATPHATGGGHRDLHAESLKTLAAAESAAADGAPKDIRSAVPPTRAAGCAPLQAQHNSTSFGRYAECEDATPQSDHSDHADDPLNADACASIVDVVEETTLADMSTFTPVLPSGPLAQHARAPAGDDQLALLTPPGPLSSDTSESRPSSSHHGGAVAAAAMDRPAILSDPDSAPLQGSPAPLCVGATGDVASLPLAQSPVEAETPSPAAGAVGRALGDLGALSGEGCDASSNPGGPDAHADTQGSLLSDGPPRAQGAISPILEHEVTEFADGHAVRHRAPHAAHCSAVSVGMADSVDVAMGSLAGKLDFGRMGSSSAGGVSSGGVTSAQLLQEPSDESDRGMPATPR